MVKKEFTKVISQSGDDRLRLKIETKKGKVAERRRSEVSGQKTKQRYAMRKFDEEWHPIVRYDCSHGFLHRDVMFPGGKKEKHPLDIPDLKTALIYAEQDIKDRWKWYRDRYRRRLRK